MIKIVPDGGAEYPDGASFDSWGEEGAFPFRTGAAAALVRTPDYPREPEASVTAEPADDGRGLVLTWDHTERSGFYDFLLMRTDGTQINRLVAVNVDPTEGDLEMASEQALRRALPGVQLTYVKGTEHLADDVGEARVEMWRPALLMAMIVLLGEQSLAWWLGRRR